MESITASKQPAQSVVTIHSADGDMKLSDEDGVHVVVRLESFDDQ